MCFWNQKYYGKRKHIINKSDENQETDDFGENHNIFMTGQDLHKYYKIFDVTPDTPWEDIKRAYHDMMKVWHPDRFAGDPRLQKIVEEKTKELTHAFKKIEEDYHSIKFYNNPSDEAEEASIKTKTKPQTEPPAKEGKPKSSRDTRKQEAEECLKKAKRIETGNYRAVVDYLNKAIDLDPSLEEAYIERGEAYAMLGNHGQAVEDFNEVIEFNSKSFKGFRGRANAYSELGNHSQAIIDFTSAIELEPVNYPELYYLRGKSHEILENRNEAKEDFKNANVLKILNTQSHKSHTSSELDDEWKIGKKRRVSFKQVGLHIMATICVLSGIIILTLPIFLSKDIEKGEPKKEMTKDVVVPASPFSILEKAIPIPAPLPISDYEKAFKTGKDKPRDDARSNRQVKETGLITSPLERKNNIQIFQKKDDPVKEMDIQDSEKKKVTDAEKAFKTGKDKPRDDTRLNSQVKETGLITSPLERENNVQILQKKDDPVKEMDIQDSEKKKVTDAEKERVTKEKKFQQLEKLRALEKEFPLEQLKGRFFE